MKHIIIGDLHGKDCWKDIQIGRYDKVIFVGDYVDHWSLPDDVIYQNLQDVIQLKQRNPEKVELLLGNHDAQYLHYPQFLCSGFRPGMQPLLTLLFNEHRNLFNVAYQKENYIISHAGITNKWYTEFVNLHSVQQIREEQDTIASLVNKVEQTAQRAILHRAGRVRGGEGHGGITWADRTELMEDMLDGYHQVVGHTTVPEVEVVDRGLQSVTFIDVLDTVTYFHELVI
jgi:hypothetical protein